MNWFEQVLKFLDATMAVPLGYGWFHLMFLAITIVCSVLVIIFGKKFSDKQNRIFLFTIGMLMIIFEIYKQLNYSFNSTTGVWHYHWYAFPFQFCSTPFYVMVLASLVKKGKFQQALFNFLGTFTLLAGLLVMVIPGGVFTTTVGINIQTMFVHGGMVVVGLYMLFSGRIPMKFKSILSAIYVFVGLVLIAMTMNMIAHFSGLTDTFNMFFISPFFPNTLPVLGMINSMLPYPVYLVLYVMSFSLGAFLLLSIGILANVINRRIKNKKAARSGNTL